MPSPTISNAIVRGESSRAIVTTLFGVLWGILAILTFGSQGEPFLPIGVGVIAALLLAAAFRLRRSARRLPVGTAHWSARIGQRYAWVAYLEFAAIIAVFLIFNLLHQRQFITPVIAIVVGLHFLLLAPTVHVRWYYVTGAALCFIAVVTMLVAPVRVTTSGPAPYQIDVWQAVISVGSAIILWTDALVALITGTGMLLQSRHISEQATVEQAT